MSTDRVITWLELIDHLNEESCWLVMDGKVYDVTKYLDEHPGSKFPLLKYAGQDCSKQFESVGHSQGAREIRNGLQIGVIEQSEPTKEYWFKLRNKNWENFKFTEEQVAQHDKEGDRWIIIGDHVYDFSELKHPGGEQVINFYAGKDGSEKFNQVEKHIENAVKNKENYRIGKVQRPQAEAPPAKANNSRLYIVAGVAVALVGAAIFAIRRKK